jgi:hypothetical protein
MPIRLSLSPAVRVARHGLLFLFATGLTGTMSPNASAQSVWDQLKAQAKKSTQPGDDAGRRSNDGRREIKRTTVLSRPQDSGSSF